MASGDITLVMSAEMGGFVSAMMKAQDRVAGVEDGAKKLATAANRAAGEIAKTGEVGEKAAPGVGMVGGAMGGLTMKLATLVGPGALLAAFVGMLKEVRDGAHEAAAGLIAQADAMSKLVLVSQPMGKEATQKTMALAEQITIETGMSAAAAAEVVRQGKSRGLTDAEIHAIGKTKLFGGEAAPAAFAQIVGDLQSPAAFGKGAGSAQQIISALIKAGVPAGVSPEQLGPAVFKAAGAVQAVGGNLDEALGLISTLSPGFGGPDPAAAAVKMLALKIGKEGYGGYGVRAGLEAWQAKAPKDLEAALAGAAPPAGAGGPLLKGEHRAKPEPGMEEELEQGRAGALLAWKAIQRSGDLIARRMNEVAQARLSGAEYEAALGAADVPKLTAAQQFKQAEATYDVAMEGRAQATAKLNALIKAYMAIGEELPELRGWGDRAIRTGIDRHLTWWNELFTGPEQATKDLAFLMAGRTPAFEPLSRLPRRGPAGPAGYFEPPITPDQWIQLAQEIVDQRLRAERGGPALAGTSRERVERSLDSLNLHAERTEQNTRPTYTALRGVRDDDRE